MKYTKIVLVIAFLILGTLTYSFILKGSSENVGASLPVGQSTNPIKIGASISLTGVAADFGQMSKKAMELAVEEINAKGGVDGRKVELYIEDDQTDPKSAVSAYRKLVDTNSVEAVIGGIFDFTAQPIFPLAEKDKVTFISPVNFVIDGSFEMNPYSFVMYPRFDQVVRELDSVIASKNIKTLGMIRFESGFSESIQNTLKGIMQNQNGQFVVETYKAIGGSDFRTNILKLTDSALKGNKLDAVFLDMLDFDIVKYLGDSKNLGFKKQIIGYTTLRDVLKNDKVNKADLEGAIMLDWEIPSAEFSRAFEAKYGEVPRRGANKSYDAVYVLAEAIAGAENKENIPNYIESRSFKTKNGTFRFGANHAVTDTPVKVFEVKAGQLVEIKSN
jgi:branched-chain amino acid transport system substrate-binding protein